MRFDWHADGVELTVSSALLQSPAPIPTAGHGIVGMRERAALVGGWLTAEPKGTVFVVAAGIPREVNS